MSRIDDLRALHELVAMLGLDVAIEDDIKGDCHWGNEFHVNRDWGEGLHFAAFQFRPHAELFVEAVTALPALLDVASAAQEYSSARLSGESVRIGDAWLALGRALDRLEASTHDASGGPPATHRRPSEEVGR